VTSPIGKLAAFIESDEHHDNDTKRQTDNVNGGTRKLHPATFINFASRQLRQLNTTAGATALAYKIIK